MCGGACVVVCGGVWWCGGCVGGGCGGGVWHVHGVCRGTECAVHGVCGGVCGVWHVLCVHDVCTACVAVCVVLTVCLTYVSVRIRPRDAPNWVAERLGASSRRPRHPFPALMAGVNPGRVPVYTALKTTSSPAPVVEPRQACHHPCPRTASARLDQSTVWHNNGHAHILVQKDWTCGTP